MTGESPGDTGTLEQAEGGKGRGRTVTVNGGRRRHAERGAETRVGRIERGG